MLGAKDIRNAISLTQAEIAIRHDLSDRTVRLFENGRLSPSPRTRRKLAAAYGVTFEQVDQLARGQRVDVPQLAAG